MNIWTENNVKQLELMYKNIEIFEFVIEKVITIIKMKILKTKRNSNFLCSFGFGRLVRNLLK